MEKVALRQSSNGKRFHAAADTAYAQKVLCATVSKHDEHLKVYAISVVR